MTAYRYSFTFGHRHFRLIDASVLFKNISVFASIFCRMDRIAVCPSFVSGHPASLKYCVSVLLKSVVPLDRISGTNRRC